MMTEKNNKDIKGKPNLFNLYWDGFPQYYLSHQGEKFVVQLNKVANAADITGFYREIERLTPFVNQLATTGIYAMTSYELLAETSKVYEFGAQKYGRGSYTKQSNVSVWLNAIARHFIKYDLFNEKVDEESGISHLGHILANIMIILSGKEHGNLVIDIIEGPKSSGEKRS